MAVVAIIQFPGVNCEYETLRAVELAGLEGAIVRWNEEGARIRESAAIILPGGFSYQDRIRAGVVAAKERVMDEVVDAAERGVPVMGICNGAQILVEAGVVPDLDDGSVAMALAPNRMPLYSGYYCAWVRVKKGPAPCVFTEFLARWHQDAGTVPLPVAHAEGRFVTSSPQVRKALEEGQRVALLYAEAGGSPAASFPANPNGSLGAIAGLTNSRGNVLALMPHPERASWLYQVPTAVGGYWERERLRWTGETMAAGPALGFFSSLASSL